MDNYGALVRFGAVVLWPLLLTASPLRAQGSQFAGPCRAEPPADLISVVGSPETAAVMISRNPRTPEAARKHGYKGAVRLAFVVDTSGKAEVSTAIVLAASDQLMRDWACGYVSEIRFTPATHEGRLVRTQVVVPFSFCATVVQERLPKNPPPCVVALP